MAGALAASVVGWMLGSHGLARAAWPPPADTTNEGIRGPETWPDDPLYGYVASTSTADRREGQWELYSFVPDRSATDAAEPSTEVASGVSVDLAWRHSVGNPSVVLAIASTGIDWNERDLFAQVALNRGELRVSPPLHEDSTPCAPLDPTAPTLDRFDCDGDGRLTVADYAEHPALEPTDVDPPGDTNGNGWFDPQDLLRQSFVSNGTDDDANGYVDDVVGWDFVDDDSDPFDEAGSRLGTREALAAAAETNNAIGGAGACPGCRVLPLRVATSTRVSPQTLAVATVYAADRGARVLGVVGEAWGRSSLLDSAITYGHEAGTLVVAASGSSFTRRPPAPTTHPLVLGVGAVTLGGADATSTTASTFLAAGPCSGFGAHRLLSIPARDCPASVVGLTTGVAGLVVSAGLDSGLGGSTPSLTSKELALVLTSTADDVDVIESREESSTLAWSQPGFDQHFGYGRLHANRAVEQVIRGAVPATLELESPTGFAALYADQVKAPVPILGKVAAKRAQSYDYAIEWAPGVEPSESAFQLLAEEQGVLGSVVSGEETALAELDIRSLVPAATSDVVTIAAADTTTVTIRIRATAHYADPLGDVASELRRAVSIQRDAALLTGFPLRVGSTATAGPKLADIDGDGIRDIVVTTADGEIRVWSVATGEAVLATGFPCFSPKRELPASKGFDSTGGVDPTLARESFVGAPAIGDLDADGKLEIVATTATGTIVVVDARGRNLPGWPQRLPSLFDCNPEQEDDCPDPAPVRRGGVIASPVLEDLTDDGTPEIVQAGLDGTVHVFATDGEPLDGWPVRLESASDLGQPVLTTPTAVDLNGDAIPDLVVPTSLGGGTASYTAIDGRGNRSDEVILEGWPVDVVDWPLGTAVQDATPGPASAGDFSGDGKAEVVLHGNVSVPFIVPAAPGPQRSPEELPAGSWPVREPATGARGIEYTGRFGAESNADPSEPMFPILSRPSLGDLDQDGTPDVVTSGASRDVAEQLARGTRVNGPDEYLLAFWDGETGAMFPGSPTVVAGSPWYGDAAIADITGDGYPEVISGTDGFLVHAVDACGHAPPGWPKATGQWVSGSPAVGDLDGDGTLEVVVTTRNGWVFAWHTSGSTDGTIAWASQHHDNRNTGSLTTDLDQGRYLTAKRPLFISVGGRCLLPGEEAEPENRRRFSPAGGCSCRQTSPPRTGSWSIVLLGVGIALARRCSRRKRARRNGSVAKVGLEPTTPRL